MPVSAVPWDNMLVAVSWDNELAPTSADMLEDLMADM